MEEIDMSSRMNGNCDLEVQPNGNPVKTLPTPVLQSNKGVIRPILGSWSTGSVLDAADVGRWGFVVLEPTLNCKADYSRIAHMLQTHGCLMGMSMKLIMPQALVKMRDLPSFMFECKKRDVMLLFIVLPQGDKGIYHEVKQVAEQTVGIMTQCIREETALKGINGTIVRSLLMKVNTKFMGVNHALHPMSLPTCIDEPESVMAVGGHLLLATREQSDTYKSRVPAIAATAASIDMECTRYNTVISIQDPKRKEIVDMEDMMVEHLTLYVRYNGGLPTTILYFRSCMTETMYNETESYELGKFLKAYARVLEILPPGSTAAATPKILYMLVESPRNARFKPLDWDRSWDNLSKYTAPGTVISHRVDPTNCDRQIKFSMVSYNGMGRRRLSNYFIYYNNAVPNSELEKLTYYLCYLCGRGSRVISCPTPLYYTPARLPTWSVADLWLEMRRLSSVFRTDQSVRKQEPDGKRTYVLHLERDGEDIRRWKTKQINLKK